MRPSTVENYAREARENFWPREQPPAGRLLCRTLDSVSGWLSPGVIPECPGHFWPGHWVQSSSGIMTVIAGCGSSMSNGPQVAISLKAGALVVIADIERNGNTR